MNPIAQYWPHRRRTIVVLSGPDVPAAAVEIQMRTAGFQGLLSLAGQSAEVGRDLPVAVVAHRVAGVIVAGGDPLVSAVERNRSQIGVDQSLRLRSQGGIGATTTTHLVNLAIRSEDAAIGGDFLDGAATRGDVCERSGFVEAVADGLVKRGYVGMPHFRPCEVVSWAGQ